MVSRELEAESVVVFDEAHNIDNVCTEALSVDLDKRSLDAASRCLGKISSKVRRTRCRPPAATFPPRGCLGGDLTEESRAVPVREVFAREFVEAWDGGGCSAVRSSRLDAACLASPQPLLPRLWLASHSMGASFPSVPPHPLGPGEATPPGYPIRSLSIPVPPPPPYANPVEMIARSAGAGNMPYASPHLIAFHPPVSLHYECLWKDASKPQVSEIVQTDSPFDRSSSPCPPRMNFGE